MNIPLSRNGSPHRTALWCDGDGKFGRYDAIAAVLQSIQRRRFEAPVRARPSKRKSVGRAPPRRSLAAAKLHPLTPSRLMPPATADAGRPRSASETGSRPEPPTMDMQAQGLSEGASTRAEGTLERPGRDQNGGP
jgi:hypothetical protein